MARNEPGSASSEIFICINDQPELDYNGSRNPDGLGFAAFGMVKSGMDIVKKIQQSPSDGQMLKKPIRVKSIKRIWNLTVITKTYSIKQLYFFGMENQTGMPNMIVIMIVLWQKGE